MIDVILLTVAVLAFIEGLFMFLFSLRVKKVLREMSKRKFKLRKIGLIEMIIAIIVFLVVLFF